MYNCYNAVVVSVCAGSPRGHCNDQGSGTADGPESGRQSHAGMYYRQFLYIIQLVT